MKLKRIIRDLLVLAVFCGAFYASTKLVGQYESESAKQKDTNFSTQRIEGDRLSVDEDWVESAKLYRQMTEVDPFNGYAWRRLGRCYTNIRSNQRKAIRDEELSDSPSERKLEELRQDLLVTDQLALKAWEKAREHPRYRRVALYQLAAIRTARSELDEAMALLEEFVFVEGYILPNDLHKFRDFGSSKVLPGESENDFDANREETTGLHQFDRFWELAKEEQKERRANSRPGQIEPQGMRSVPPRK